MRSARAYKKRLPSRTRVIGEAFSTSDLSFCHVLMFPICLRCETVEHAVLTISAFGVTRTQDHTRLRLINIDVPFDDVISVHHRA